MAANPGHLQGTVDVLILKTLSWGAMHGYAITRWVARTSGGALEVEGAALYQGLHRLERKRLIRSEWGVSENNRRAKYYALTPEGRRALREEGTAFRTFASAVLTVLDAAGPAAAEGVR